MATHGRGKIAAIYGVVDTRFSQAHYPRALLSSTARPLPRRGRPPLSPPTPRRASISHSAAPEDGWLTVHLLNRANEPASVTTGSVDFIPPIGSITLRVRTQARPTARRVDPGPTPRSRRPGPTASWTATVPRLEVHGVLAITE